MPPRPGRKVKFMGMNKRRGCGKKSKCSGYRLYGQYWIEADKVQNYLYVDATMEWKSSPPKYFGW